MTAPVSTRPTGSGYSSASPVCPRPAAATVGVPADVICVCRRDGPRSRDGGGAGLGLAVVKALVTDLGGRVNVEDSPLGGARFIVSFPYSP